jgi:X-X-X-Leu-X-X-Gly heptad repeat protein
MIKLARISIRRPRAALAIWTVTGVVLALIGFGVSHSLSPSITVVSGTQSARAEQLANAKFGPTQLVPILIEGPKKYLNKEGPALVRALSHRPRTRVMSAWDGGPVTAQLRRGPNDAMIVVSVDRSEKTVVTHDQPQIGSLVAHYVTAPLKSYISGQPSIDRAVKSASIDTLRHDQLIAVGIVFVLLLIGLRTPVAAGLVTVVGAVSMLAGFGEVALLGHVFSVDPLAVALGTMTGLALAVGFALLILDRFHREEFADAEHPRDAASAALDDLQTTGRAVLVGGTAIALALVLVALIGPMELMVSLGTGMLTCALFAIGGTVVVMPAALVLLGRRIEWLRFPAPGFLTRGWDRLVDEERRVTRFAVFSGAFATLALAALAVPAFSLSSGPTSISQLPSNSSARIAFEKINKVMGAGFATPYNLIVVSPKEPITTPALLAQIKRFEVKLAHVRGVESVTGPDAIGSVAHQLKPFGPGLKHSAAVSDKSKKDLVKLINGLGKAGSGSQQLQQGLTQAASGSSQIASGSGQIQSGAGQLAAGLATAKAAASSGFNQILGGVSQLKAGAGEALAGARTLQDNIGLSQSGVPDLTSQAGQLKTAASGTSSAVSSAKSQVASAQSAVQQALGSIPNDGSSQSAAARAALERANSSLSSVSGTLSSASSNAAAAATAAGNMAYSVSGIGPAFQTLHQNTAKLANGIAQIEAGDAKLAAGVSSGGGQLTSGFNQLISGANQLQFYLGQLTNGAGQLASGLSAAPGGAGQLVAGLNKMQAAVIKSRKNLPSTAALHKLFEQSPGMFNSGYFVLAAVEGAPGTQRIDATFAINLLHGGTAAQIMVVPRHPSNDPRTVALGTTLDQMARQFAAASHTQIAVGGPEGNLGDLTSVTKSHIWLDVAAIAAAIALVLAIALRAVLLPLVATAFSLLVTASTFGVLSLLFGGTDPLLGGPGTMDPMTIIGVFTIVFGITIFFSTVLLMRTREAFISGVPAGRAVLTALRETAAGSTGAGIVMIAAVIPFALTDLINVKQFGIGVAVAILLDVLLVRPVLLPAAEVVLGRFGWWPTSGPPGAVRATRKHRVPRPRLPHRTVRPAHQ